MRKKKVAKHTKVISPQQGDGGQIQILWQDHIRHLMFLSHIASFIITK